MMDVQGMLAYNLYQDERVESYDPRLEYPISSIEEALKWLAHDSKSVLEYGCASGKSVLRTMCMGVERSVGIDRSAEAIHRANEDAVALGYRNQAFFLAGGLHCLHEMEPASFEGAILFDVINSQSMEEALDTIQQVHRILVYRGRMLLKINAWIDQTHLENDYEKLEVNYYKSIEGKRILNLSQDQVEDLLMPYFYIENKVKIFLNKENQYQRLYYLRAM